MDLQMVSYLGKLSKITFSEDELQEMAKDMTDIIGIMDTVREIDVTYDAELDNKNVFLYDLRQDEEHESMPTEKILQNAQSRDNCFVVPKVVE